MTGAALALALWSYLMTTTRADYLPHLIGSPWREGSILFVVAGVGACGYGLQAFFAWAAR